MGFRFSVILIIFILFPIVYSISNEEIIKKARDYKRYNEFIENTSIVKFYNQSYFIVDFSSRGYPSGCIILDVEGNAVSNRTVVSSILTMRILKQYDKSTVDNWGRISSSFRYFSAYYRDYDILNKIFENLSELSDTAHNHMRRCFFNSSANDAGDYLKIERKILSGVMEVKGIVEYTDIEKKDEVMDYLIDLENFLDAEIKGIDKFQNIYLNEIETRIKTANNRNDIQVWSNNFMIGVFVFIVILLLLKKIRRGS